MDDTAWEMVKIVRDSENDKRIQDAANTLTSVLPALDEESVDKVIWEMTKIIRDSDNATRRRVAQQTLVVFKNMKSM